MRRLAVLGLTLGAAAVADDDVQPVPVHVRATRDGVGAIVEVDYRIHTTGPLAGPLLVADMPVGAIVTGATATIGGTSHALALVAPGDSPIKRLQATNSSDDRAWAITIDAIAGSMMMVSGAIARPSVVDLHLEMRAPTCFDHDARYVALPESWPQREQATTCAGTHWIALPDRDAADRPSGERLAITADGLSPEHIAHVELDLASALADVPADLATAIVIDHSRSLDPAEQAGIARVITAYLAATPASRVQAIAFARTATSLLSVWTPARDAEPAITRALTALPAHNGSNLDVALAEAASWLARVPGTHRVLVITDALLANRIREDQLRAGDALIHVVDLDPNSVMMRDDAAPLAKVALATGGIAVRAGRDPFDAAMLAHPISLDHVAITAPGWTRLLQNTCSDDLAEGSGCTWWGRGSGPITVEGDLWGRHVLRVVAPDPSRGREVARALAATPQFDDDLDADAVARDAFAVDRVWSLAATWGGSGGYDDAQSGVGVDTMGGSCCGSSDRGVIIGGVGDYAVRPKDGVDVALAHAVAGCKLTDGRVELALELTRSEIVDVEARVVPREGATLTSGTVHDCIVERVWDTDLVIPSAPERSTRRLVVVSGAE